MNQPDHRLQIELVDRDNHVIAHESVPASAFPLTIRLVGHEQEIAPSSGPVSTRMAMRQWMLSPIGVALMVALCAGIFAISSYGQAFDKTPGGQVLARVLEYLLALIVWSGLWALGGRIARGHARFRLQFLWAATWTVATLVIGYVIMALHFLFPDATFVTLFIGIAWLAVVLVLLYGHLTITSRMPPRRRWSVAGLVVAVVVGLIGLGAYVESGEFNTTLEYDATILPLDARYIPSTSVSTFLKDVDAVHETVDKERSTS